MSELHRQSAAGSEDEPVDERSVAVEVAPEHEEDLAEVEDKFDALREEVAVRGGVALDSPEGGRYGGRFSVSAGEPAQAVEQGVAAFERAAEAAGLPKGRVLDVEAPTMEELGHHPARGEVPDLIDLSGLGEALGVNRHLAPIVARSKGFPRPVAELNGGPVWTRESVDRYLRSAAGQGGEQAGEQDDGQDPPDEAGAGSPPNGRGDG
jgi:hypothetical protein